MKKLFVNMEFPYYNKRYVLFTRYSVNESDFYNIYTGNSFQFLSFYFLTGADGSSDSDSFLKKLPA